MKCSLDYPSCQRCLLRGWTCEYESKPQPPDSRKAGRVSGNSPVVENDPHTIGTDTSNSMSALSTGSTQLESELPLGDGDGAFAYSENTSQGYVAADFSKYSDGIYGTPTFEDIPGLFFVSINRDPFDVGDAYQISSLAALQPDDNILSELTHTQLSSGSAQFLDRDPLDPLNSENLPNFRSPFHPGMAEVPANYRNIVAYGVVISKLPSHPSADNLIEFTRNYPQRMLDIEYWPPFIHSRLYRCSAGGVSEPVAIALCCLSARLNGFESSVQFLNNMIDNERARLLDSFVSRLLSFHWKCLFVQEYVAVD